MKTTQLCAAWMLGFGALAFGPAAAADTITVCLDGSCDFTDIQAAINASQNGDVIEIAAGTYYPAATLSISGKSISLQGAVDAEGVPLTVLDGMGQRRLVVIIDAGVGGTLLQGLHIRNGVGVGGQGSGVLSQGSAVTIGNCKFEAGVGGSAVRTTNGAISVENSQFVGNSGSNSGGLS